MKTSLIDTFKINTGRYFRHQYNWVPDGIYDYSFYKTRFVIIGGDNHFTISKMWLDSGNLGDCHSDLKLPWGTYPDLPPKPGK